MSSSSHILVLGSNSVRSLVPSTLIAQVESLLESHKLDDAFAVADTRRKKLEESIEVDEDQAEELRYVYQLLGFQQFRETLFEDAGNNLFNGHIDPRLLVSYFPQLRGGLFSDEDSVDVFSGVAERMPTEASMSISKRTLIQSLLTMDPDAVVSNLVRNYSPHLRPDTGSAPPTAELRKILQERALEMLETFLKKERRRRMALDLDKDGPESAASSKGKEKERPRPIRTIIDTVLAKIYAQSEKTADLYDLLFSPNYVLLSEVEDVFRTTGQYNALCMMYQRGGAEYDEKLLDVWSKLIDGEWIDPDIPDPLLQMVSLLMGKHDSALSQKWGIWMLKRDQDAAIRLLTTLREATVGSGKRRERERAASGEDLALLQQIDMASPSAAKHYLEYLVLQKRSQVKELHDRLALACINEVLSYLRDDDAVSKLWRAKVSSYSSSTSKSSRPTVPPPFPTTSSMPPSFFSYFASTTPESPSKRARLASILFLAGSRLYDPEIIRERITEEKREKILSLEIALLEGKAGSHRSALTTLARDLNDAASAEAYCNLQGEFIPPKVAISVAESAGLNQWVEGLAFGSQLTGKQKAQSISEPKPTDETKSRELLKVLLEVYMSDESPSSSERASQLLSAQAVNLDVLDVLDSVPPSWSLPSLTPFLSRSFRRITHQRREVMIAKSISAGQNLEVKETTYEPLRVAGAYVEDELDEDDDSGAGEGEEYDEKRGLVESVVDIVAGDARSHGEVTSEKVPVEVGLDGAADSLLQ